MIDIKYGKWIPGKGHLKKCPFCGNDFYGRKNRIYCPNNNDECKIKANNNTAYLRRKDYKGYANIGEKNAAILKMLYDKGSVEIYMNNLVHLGFVGDGPYTPIKNNNLIGEWFRYGDYILQYDSKTNIVKIQKLI